jgi:transcriptional regulator with XRE-family HTH domain
LEKGQYGRRIRAFRKLKRIQQTEFAKRINISVTTLGRIERGEKMPTEETIQTIADALAIDIKELKGE